MHAAQIQHVWAFESAAVVTKSVFWECGLFFLYGNLKFGEF